MKEKEKRGRKKGGRKGIGEGLTGKEKGTAKEGEITGKEKVQ